MGSNYRVRDQYHRQLPWCSVADDLHNLPVPCVEIPAGKKARLPGAEGMGWPGREKLSTAQLQHRRKLKNQKSG